MRHFVCSLEGPHFLEDMFDWSFHAHAVIRIFIFYVAKACESSHELVLPSICCALEVLVLCHRLLSNMYICIRENFSRGTSYAP